MSAKRADERGGRSPAITIRATDETLPYGAVTNQATDKWAVIHVASLEVAGDRLYATVEEALAAAADRRHRDEVNERANRNFDEEMSLWREGNDFGRLGGLDE